MCVCFDTSSRVYVKQIVENSIVPYICGLKKARIFFFSFFIIIEVVVYLVVVAVWVFLAWVSVWLILAAANGYA